MKRKSVLPATSLDQFFEKEEIHVGVEKQHDIHTTTDLPSSFVDEHNKEFDNFVEQEEIGEDGCARKENIKLKVGQMVCLMLFKFIIQSNFSLILYYYINLGISEKKKVRGKTTCKNIHARNLDERKDVTFYKRQAVGPAEKMLSNLSSFIRTVARNSK